MGVDAKIKMIEDAKKKPNREERNDFMAAWGKGDDKDPLTRQVPVKGRKIDAEKLADLYTGNAMVQNIVDIPAEDLTRAGFTLHFKDQKMKAAYESKLRQLDAKDIFKSMYAYDRLYGDGFISIGTVESKTHKLSDPVDLNSLKRIPYINAFSGKRVSNFGVNEDMFSENYGKVEKFELKRNKQDKEWVHHSRLIHQRSKRLEGEHQGISLIGSLIDIITVMDVSLWSVGQILYDYVFKVYKTPDVDELSGEQKAELGALLDHKFRTEALAIIGADEELGKESTQVAGIESLLDFVWDYLSGAVRMPKTILKGQEAGTLTGAEYDVMNYYSRITAIQENELRPQLEYLIRCLMWAEEECGGRHNPDEIEWSIEFNPLWSVDAKTDAEIRKITAETDQIYIMNGVVSPDEVNEARFARFGVQEGSKFNADSGEYDGLAKATYEAYKQHMKDKKKNE